MDKKTRPVISLDDYMTGFGHSIWDGVEGPKRFSVLCGGGPAPGYMGVLYGACKRAMDCGWECIGFIDGWKGVLNNNYRVLSFEMLNSRSYWENGTIIGTSRTKLKRADGNDQFLDAKKVLFEEARVDALLALGGEDTQSISDILFRTYGCPVIGAPKTIDWDVCATERTFGADTAANHIAYELRGLKFDAAATHYIMVVEVMGRNCGRLALNGGLAGGAHVILIPEQQIPFPTVAAQVMRAHKKFGYAIVVVSEELSYSGFTIEDKGPRDQFNHVEIAKRDKGWGHLIADELESQTGIKSRHVVLGHAQRGGQASALDTVMTLKMGQAAFECAAKGEFGKLMSWQGEKVVPVELALVGGGQTREVTEEEYLEALRLLYIHE